MIAGIDPGVSGAIAVLYDDGKIYEVHDMPTLEKPSGKREVNASALADILGEHVLRYVVLERVQAAPVRGRRQGVASMFNFGEAYGVCRGVCAGLEQPVVRVVPQVWKKVHGLIKSEKDDARLLVRKKYPEDKDLFARKMDQGRADAVLIGLFGLFIEQQDESGSKAS